MGNQLVGVAPSQIFPVEYYLTHSDLQFIFERNLGSTRFFKSALASLHEGPVVVKVFVRHDLSLLLQPHQQRIDDIKSKLASAFNCLPFRKTVLESGAAFLIREYVKYSLYDRLSTRPFLAPVEKKWIAFQILCALHQCHKVGVCHGDLKLENIMVTSWHWVLLTDFASFKPTYLPDDNPAEYSYFFDTSRRRVGAIAVERFGSTNPDNNTFLLQEVKNDELTPAMDIFSAGCVLAELFSDGHSLFDLSELLAYRNSTDPESYPESLDYIEDQAVKDLIKAMIQRDPAKRLSAELYLYFERGRVFPKYFYSFLQSYMLMFSAPSPVLLCPDEKVERLSNDIAYIIKLLKNAELDERTATGAGSDENYSDALILITTLVTSCVRGLKLSSSKLRVLQILFELSKHTAAETILDRILPYILHLLQDDCPRVRISAIETTTNCLKLIENVPPRDANIFPEYILPALAIVVHDEAIMVKMALAQCIAQLSETSLRFLEYSQKFTLEKQEIPKYSYESELANLHDMIQQCVSSLLTDSHNTVKRTLIENGIVKLCIFFGKQKCKLVLSPPTRNIINAYEGTSANDVLLSHMITFLNDKMDKQLRGSFFDTISGVAGYIGVQCSPILTPLLQQGFTDSEEFIVCKAVNAMSALTELGLLHKTSLYELLEDTACFLIHPNLWIRQAVVGFLRVLSKSLSSVDIQCKVIPVVEVYMKYKIIQLDKSLHVLNALRPSIPRVVYDETVKYNKLELFLQTLLERQKARKMASTGQIPSTQLIPQSNQQNVSFQNFFRRMSSEEMSEKVEDKLLLISDHLRKLHKYLMNTDQQPKPSGKIDMSHLQHKIKFNTIKFDIPKDAHSVVTRRRLGTDDATTHLMGSASEEWKYMFGTNSASAKHGPSTVDTLQDSHSSKKSDSYSSAENNCDADQERSYMQYRFPECTSEFGNLIKKKLKVYETAVTAREWTENETWLPWLPPPGWKFRSSLVAHVKEHKASVNKLVTIPESGWFASCSSDGFVRLWDCAKMEGRNIANKSRQAYNTQNGALNSMTLCRNNRSLATVSEDGSIMVLNMDTGSSKMTVLNSRTLDTQEEGCAIDIAYFDPASQWVLVYATMYGSIIGWDIRTNENAWKIDNKLRHGVVTTMCMDSIQKCLIVGTGIGYHTCTDMRFRLPIASIVHPHAARVRKIIRHPKESSWIISAVQGNNEVSVWDMETGIQHVSFWASNTPPLSKAKENQHSVCALYAYNSERSPVLLCGGTDQRVRKWNLKSLRDDRYDRDDDQVIAIPAAKDTSSPVKFSYEDRLIDGTRVFQEHGQVPEPKEKHGDADRQISSVNENSQQLTAGPEQPPAGHRDTITDITMCQTSQCFLVTSSHDGVIKVWK